MATRIRHSTTSFAVNSVDRVIGRIYTLVLTLLTVEMAANAVQQAHFAYQPLFWIIFGLVFATFFGAVWNFWLGPGNLIWYRLHSLSFVIAIFLWPLQVKDASALPENFHPWMWWGLSIVLIGMVLSIRNWLAVVVLFAMPTAWFLLRQLPEYGSATAFLAAQDAAYVGLFSAAVTALIQFSRNSANKVDQASQLATEVATERARIDAIETERARVDALVHDSVLTTLLVAANAKTAGEQESAAKLATEALDRLDEVRNSTTHESDTTAASFLEALAAAVERTDAKIEITRSVTANSEIPSQVATALTEATLQAVANSVQHAGPRARRELHMKATARGLKIVIKDDGRGFRPSRVPKNRLGIRLSIRARLDLVGGKARVDSNPGEGTTVILEWDFK